VTWQCSGQVPGTVQVVIFVHAAGEHPARVTLISQVELVVIDCIELRAALFVKDHVVESDPVSLWLDVKLP
jgi:hypothetical protein